MCVTCAVAGSRAAHGAGGDDDDFGGMAASDNESLDSAGAAALAADIEGVAGGGGAEATTRAEAGAPKSRNQQKKTRKKQVVPLFVSSSIPAEHQWSYEWMQSSLGFTSCVLLQPSRALLRCTAPHQDAAGQRVSCI